MSLSENLPFYYEDALENHEEEANEAVVEDNKEELEELKTDRYEDEDEIYQDEKSKEEKEKTPNFRAVWKMCTKIPVSGTI